MSHQRVRARFISRSPKYAVTDAPIAVPIKLARQGLSEVINHLLDSTVPIPFDFLIDNKLVRGSLEKFIAQNGISTEDIIPVEYLPAVVLSDETVSAEMDAWVGSLDARMSDALVCGCYDGQVRICDTRDYFSITSTTACHEAPIRDVLSFTTGDSRQYILTASKDQSVKCWEVTCGTKKSGQHLSHISTLTGHLNSVECLDIFGKEPTILSGDWNGTIMGFNGSLMYNSHQEADKDESGGKKKKRKDMTGSTAKAETSTIEPFFTIKGHSQALSGINACRDIGSDSEDARYMYTCSWDHSLKLWDIESQNCVNTFMGPKVMTSLHYNRSANAVATSHPDGKVRLWDSRSRESSSTFEAYGGTEQWISQVKWHPENGVLLAAVDYSGHVCLWDIRAKVPLSSRPAHDGKALCVDWVTGRSSTSDGEIVDAVQVVSGGSDCAIKATAVESF